MKPELHRILKDSHLILDTDILIRVNHEPTLHTFFQECRLLPCSLLSILPVEIDLLEVFQVVKRRQILNFGIYAFSQEKFDAKLSRLLG